MIPKWIIQAKQVVPFITTDRFWIKINTGESILYVGIINLQIIARLFWKKNSICWFFKKYNL